MSKRNNKFIALGLVLFFAAIIPLTVFLTQQQQDTRSQASASTSLAIEPVSTAAAPLQKSINDSFSLDVKINPGSNLPSLVKLAIKYDPAFLQADNATVFVPNATAFPNTVEGPVISNGKVFITVSIGSDTTKAIQAPTKVGTLTFKAIAPTTAATIVSIDSASQVLSVASTDQATENVLSSTTPAYITIAGYPPTATLTPSPVPYRCSDNLDNDNNGFTDAEDSSCHTDGNPDNPDSYDPNKNGENGGGNTCGDSKDNNGNGLIDGADPICHTDGNPNNPGSYDPNRPEGDTTTLNLTVFMHGVGNSGDNANPTNHSLSNKNPKHPTRNVIVSIYDPANALTASVSGTINYSSTSGNFIGAVHVPNLSQNEYIVRIHSPLHLRRLVDGIQTLSPNTTHSLPAVSLIAGDADNNNVLNILDYNMLIDCYSDLTAAAATCTADKKLSSDFNDDDLVNQVDYNLFVREIIVQNGN